MEVYRRTSVWSQITSKTTLTYIKKIMHYHYSIAHNHRPNSIAQNHRPNTE